MSSAGDMDSAVARHMLSLSWEEFCEMMDRTASIPYGFICGKHDIHNCPDCSFDIWGVRWPEHDRDNCFECQRGKDNHV
jgi:hypothetical protein